jgi:entericidin B
MTMAWNRMAAAILLVAIGALSGCNTMDGAGKDIQGGGKAVSHAAQSAKSDM